MEKEKQQLEKDLEEMNKAFDKAILSMEKRNEVVKYMLDEIENWATEPDTEAEMCLEQ